MSKKKLVLLVAPLAVILFVNDHFLKYSYANLLTGKLSDFIGLLIFPLFLILCFPKYKNQAIITTGILFILFKLPISTPLIDWLNQLSPINIIRTVDYTDFIALLMLPISYYLTKHYYERSILKSNYKLHELAGLSVIILIFFSTSLEAPKYPKNGNVDMSESYNFNKTEIAILDSLKKEGFIVSLDSTYIGNDGVSFYPPYYSAECKIKYRGNSKFGDTIKRINFKISEDYVKKTSRLTILNVEVNNEWKLQDLKEFNREWKRIRRGLEEQFIKSID